MKMQVMRRAEAGERQADVGLSLGFAFSAIETIFEISERKEE